jgi:hypothetical protein
MTAGDPVHKRAAIRAHSEPANMEAISNYVGIASGFSAEKGVCRGGTLVV